MDYVKKTNEILVRLFNVVLKLEEKALKESSAHNLSITEIHTLAAIGIGMERTMGEAADLLQINISTLTTAINKLVKKGYVERFRISSDRRIVKIKLTKAGEDAVTEHEEFHRRMVEKSIGELSKDDIAAFVQALDNINDFLDMQLIQPEKAPEDYPPGPVTLGSHTVPKGIFQGGMGIGISMSSLASAVAAEGGLGVISGANIGFGEEDYSRHPMLANIRVLQREVEKARKAVKDLDGAGPIGVNIPYKTQNYDELVSAAVEAGAQVIITGAGLPLRLPEICRDKNVALVPVVSSLRAAKIILKNWEKKHHRRPDAFIFENVFAGGQLGYRGSRLDVERGNYYKTISDIKKEIGDIPLIVAGGIFSRDDGVHAYIYGADGIQVASRFVTTEECDAPDTIKEAYLKCTENDVTIIQTPSNMPYRAIKNSFTESLREGEDFDVNEALIRAAKGDAEKGLVFCGSKVYRQNKLERVADIIDELV